MKTARNIIKFETGKKVISDDITFVNKDDDWNNNYKDSSEVFNNYFLTIGENISHKILNNNKADCKNYIDPVYYLSQIFKNPFPNTKLNNTSTKEIEKIITSL